MSQLYANVSYRLLTSIFIVSICLLRSQLHAQSLRLMVADQVSLKPIINAEASLSGVATPIKSDSLGTILLNVDSKGEYAVSISAPEYFAKVVKVAVSDTTGTVKTVLLQSMEEDIEEVLIVSTRSQRKADDDALIVAIVNSDELEERSLDKPSSISHAIKEQTGVQLQRTSASSGTFKIRLQGLNGAYVQLVKDGLPLYGGFSNAYGLMQVSPMNLKQMEIVKGPASVLYGSDAISGVINLITREPDEDGVYDVMVNAENTRSADVAVLLSKRFERFGFNLQGNYRYQSAFDWNRDNFSDYPAFSRYNASPQLYFYPTEATTICVGSDFTFEDRKGGTMQSVRNKYDSVYYYIEKNKVYHSGSYISAKHDFGSSGALTAKAAFNYFKRSISLEDYNYSGTQLAAFAEVNYRLVLGRHDLVIGADFRSDKFTDKSSVSDAISHAYSFITPGLFAQYVFNISERTVLSAGVRLDYNTRYGVFPLPQLMFLHKFNSYFNVRLNAGAGYKLPTIFRDVTEQVNFMNVAKISNSVKPEWAAGTVINFNVNMPVYKGLRVGISQTFFYTAIINPLNDTLASIPGCVDGNCEQVEFGNYKGNNNSKGLESAISMGYKGFNLRVNYTFIDNAMLKYGVRSNAPLTAKHQVGLFAGYELFGKFTVGVDAYYFSPQKLSNGQTTRSIWELGINTQLDLSYILIFANLENILDIRQTRYGPVVTPNPVYSRPRFAEIYAPMEGTILNVGIRLRIGKILSFAGLNKRHSVD